MELLQRYTKAKQLLKRHGQQHLLTFWDELSSSQKEKLLSQIEAIEFDQVKKKVDCYITRSASTNLPKNFSAAPYYPAVPQTAQQKRKYSEAGKLGIELISKGKVAAFVVAGGQGTRLGFNGPKGDFEISPVKNKTLFQLFAEMIKAAGRKYGFKPRWYVMTSPLNHLQVLRSFRQKNYYGLKPSSVFIFQQGTEVNYSFKGKILLAGKDTLSSSPDGHGGSLRALCGSGAVADMKTHGVEYISYFQVDNPLINIFDPLFVGLHVMDKAQMSSKAIMKTKPFEKVGNFCLVDGKVAVIEYSDLPKKLAKKTNSDGSLVFSLGSIAIHIISRSFVELLNRKNFALPFHRAKKEIPYIDLQTGKTVKPQKRNGIKLETFVFDALRFDRKSIILETIRGKEFAPVKEKMKKGPDNPQVARQMMIARAAMWLEQAGVRIPRKSDGSINCTIEISPSFALCSKDVSKKKNKIPQIKAGGAIYLE
jgi:UDP-N-acetylglucosamine/UDP-N-acetylgalactosamine diphosphorylase